MPNAAWTATTPSPRSWDRTAACASPTRSPTYSSAPRKRRASLENCLAWLDANLAEIRDQLPAERIRLFELGLFAVLEHFAFRNPIDLSAMDSLTGFMAAFGQRASARATPYRVDTPPA